MSGTYTGFVVAALLTVSAWRSGAQDTQTSRTGTNLTFAAVVSRVVSDNPGVRSLRARLDALGERPSQAASLDNPMLKYGAMDTAEGGEWPDTNEKRVMLEQPFPWFGKRGLRADLARKDEEAMRHTLDGAVRDAVMAAKESYYGLYAVRRALEVARNEGTVLRRMAAIAETMYATGERTQQDALKARTEISMLEQRVLDLEAQQNTWVARLNALLDRRADAPLGTLDAPPPAEVTVGPETLFGLADDNRPDIRAARVQVERAELERRLKEKEYYPDYRLGIEYREIGNDEHMLMATVGVELPIWQSKYRAGVREAEKMRVSKEAALEAAQRKGAFDVEDAYFKWQTARRSLDLYRRELIPQAETRFKASEADYQTGKTDFMDFLESQRFLLNLRVMAAMSEGDVGMQAARVERAVGADLTALRPAKEGTP